jgi:hypothetical protein
MALLGGACLGGVLIVFLGENNENLMPVMVTLAKGGIKVSLDLCYLGNSLTFPAIFAGTTFGICNIFGKVATIVSPVLAEVRPPAPMIVFSVVTAIGTVVPIFIRIVPG